MQDDIVIVGAARTPVGAFNGALASLPAHELGKVAIAEALKRAGVEGARVSEVIMGQILTAGQGQNPARQASIAAGIPVESPAWGVNQLCGSGLRAVALGYQAILNGDSEVVVAGGQESMSQAPHCQHLRNGVKMGSIELIDTMIKDGLWDAFNGYHMGNTAENVAKQWQITRQQQDEFAVKSQNKAEQAMKTGKFKDEIAVVTISSRKGDIVQRQVGADMLVGVEQSDAFAALHLNGQDLLLEAPLSDGTARAAMALHGKRILRLPRNLVAPRDIFSRDAHMAAAERIAQHLQQGVEHDAIAHFLAPAPARQHIGRPAHAFGAATDGDLGVAQQQALRGRHNSLQPRPA
jgi:acetyl-CoA acetyltransferase